MKNRIKILLLDAEARSTLAILRSIGKNYDFELYVAGRKNDDICRFSKYAKKFFLYEDPLDSKNEFINSLELIIKENNIDYIFPCSDLTFYPICESDFYDAYKDKLIAPDSEKYLITFDKKRMNEVAQKCDVLVPKEYERDALVYPCVIKPRQSRFYINDKMVHGFREFVKDEKEANDFFIAIKNMDNDPLIQEIVEGSGNGVFLASKDGEIFATFSHERIREVPPGGGASTLRKATVVNNKLLKSASQLIYELKWSGIAMVEFKGDYFIEINGRPWGSMDLAISSGVDFPSMMIEMFVNKKDISELKSIFNSNYDENHLSKWIEGEFEYINYLKKLNKVTLWDKIKIIILPFRNVSYDTFKLIDPLPFVYVMSKKVARKVLRK